MKTTDTAPQVKVTDDTFDFCIDCMMLEFGDAEAWLDYYYRSTSLEAADNVESKYALGRADLVADGGIIPRGYRFAYFNDLGRCNEFSIRPCDCCHSPLAGKRYTLGMVVVRDSDTDRQAA